MGAATSTCGGASMKSRRCSGGIARAVVVSVAPLASGCSPTLNVLGVYFPAWLLSVVIGLVMAYATVWWLGRNPRTRSLAQSGLFFCSLAAVTGMLFWGIAFAGF